MVAILDFQLEWFKLLWSTSHSNINVYGPYKCMGKQIWRGKKVKRQHRTIILAILADVLSPIICAKIRAQDLFGFGEEDFKRFLPYMGIAAILINGQQPF